MSIFSSYRASSSYFSSMFQPRTVYGTVGDDHMTGGWGNDTLLGGYGRDSLFGGLGNDRLYGEDGHDYMDGGVGDDSLDGGRGNDALYGGSGNDTLDGGDGEDFLYAHDGDDALRGGLGNDNLWGFEGNDNLYGGGGNDSLIGGADNDYLAGGLGRDVLHGGQGSDTFSFWTFDVWNQHQSASPTITGQADIILDWNGAEDRIWGAQLGGYAELCANVNSIEEAAAYVNDLSSRGAIAPSAATIFIYNSQTDTGYVLQDCDYYPGWLPGGRFETGTVLSGAGDASDMSAANLI
jgi:Ca2+-binding RTX toxin-like protein